MSQASEEHEEPSSGSEAESEAESEPESDEESEPESEDESEEEYAADEDEDEGDDDEEECSDEDMEDCVAPAPAKKKATAAKATAKAAPKAKAAGRPPAAAGKAIVARFAERKVARGAAAAPAGGTESDAARRARNIAAMLAGAVQTRALPAAAGLRAPRKGEGSFKPFKAHAHLETAASIEARKTKSIGIKRAKFRPWNGRSSPVPLPFLSMLRKAEPEPEEADADEEAKVEKPFEPPPQPPLVLYDPAGDPNALPGAKVVEVDQMLCRWLRPHQREGTKFLFECCAGLRDYKGCGCILADDMGLGKTLQGIALLWTLLKQGLDGKPMIRKAIIVCPTSLVTNWDSEVTKWLKGLCKTIPLAGVNREDANASVANFLSPRSFAQVLIVSYETFRIHSEKFHKRGEEACQLLICDEAHRLKNGDTQTNISLHKLATRRRVLLSGTPLQNDLNEFFAMIDFTNPGVLGEQKRFRRYFQTPILNGREPDATANARSKGEERSAELSDLVNTFILRRTNTLNAKFLPPKLMTIVCVNLTKLQKDLYAHFLTNKDVQRDNDREDGGSLVKVLPYLNELRKLCNHPKIVYDGARARMQSRSKEQDDHAGFGADAMELFAPYEATLQAAGGFNRSSSRLNPRGGAPKKVEQLGGEHSWIELSGKFAVLARMLAEMRRTGDDRIVVVSNFTQTLDVITQLCKDNGYPYVRLDGSVSLKKRKKMVDEFNDPNAKQFVFLLSSKAGGCGLNLIGGNRLILFDPDWNPAVDKQAAARVWREGQKKECFVYRFVSTGTVEEKIYQRQLSKEKLQGVVNGNDMTTDIGTSDLADLFMPVEPDTKSTTYDLICGEEGEDKVRPSQLGYKPQEGAPLEEDLAEWAHHPTLKTLPDEVMQRAGGDDVSFVFACRVDGEFMALQKEMADKKVALDKENKAAQAKDATAKMAAKADEDQGAAGGKRKPLADADGAGARKRRSDEGAEAALARSSEVEMAEQESPENFSEDDLALDLEPARAARGGKAAEVVELSDDDEEAVPNSSDEEDEGEDAPEVASDDDTEPESSEEETDDSDDDDFAS